MIWAHARNNRIVTLHRGSTEHAVRTAGAALGLDTVEVPDGTQPGATLVNGEWVNPAPPEPAAPQPVSRKMSSVLFRYRFTPMEEAAIKLVANTDPVVSVFYDRLLDPKLDEVDLADMQVQQGLGYLATLDDPLSTATPRAKILTAARVAEILA